MENYKDKKSLSILDIIKQEEGFSYYPYKCTAGYLTIGYGWNLETNPFPEDIAEELAKRQITKIYRLFNANFDWWKDLDESRQKALISMSYQLGFSGFLKFKNMIKALEAKDYDKASEEALNSLWAKQTPNRAYRHAMIIKTGDESFFKQPSERTK